MKRSPRNRDNEFLGLQARAVHQKPGKHSPPATLQEESSLPDASPTPEVTVDDWASSAACALMAVVVGVLVFAKLF